MIVHADCLEHMTTMDANSVDAIVTDPPYGLSFMGKGWDKGVPGIPFWSAALAVLKPGGYLLAFGGTRTFHRMAVAIEDAGFEIRDTLSYLYGSGFPKSHDVGKAIDKRGGANISWFGPWLRQERERRGITQKSLAVHFPSKSGGITGCLANWELGFNLPTPDQFNKLCEVLDLPFSRIEEAEREVTGTNPNIERAARTVQANGGSINFGSGSLNTNITDHRRPQAARRHRRRQRPHARHRRHQRRCVPDWDG
jgi:transcriptional regulator with XRE-family HTH domain